MRPPRKERSRIPRLWRNSRTCDERRCNWCDRLSAKAAAPINVDHSYLKHMLKQAMRRDLVTRNVASLVTAPKPKNARSRVLEPEEWSRLYGAALVWFQPVLLTGYHTGMRLEEILTLTWDRVDLEKGRIFLPGHLTKTGQERLAPITPTLRRELQRLRVLDGVTRIQGLVFHKNGGKLSHTYREMHRLCEEQKIEDFVFHDLRHCAVTNLADSGVDTETDHEDRRPFLCGNVSPLPHDQGGDVRRRDDSPEHANTTA